MSMICWDAGGKIDKYSAVKMVWQGDYKAPINDAKLVVIPITPLVENKTIGYAINKRKMRTRSTNR